MTTESTTGESTPGSDPNASGVGPIDNAAEPTGEAPDDAAKTKVTRARATTSGAAPKGRPKSSPSTAAAAAKRATKAAAGTAVGPGRAIAVVPERDTPDSAATDPSDLVRADRVEISQGGAGRVEATTVSVTQGGIGSADARTIDVRQGGIGSASATDIAVSGGSIGFARGERVSIEMGALGGAVGDEIRVTQSMSGFVAAQGNATVDQSLVSTLIADRVTIRQPSAILVLIARQVDGTVRPLLDWRGALAAGAVAGLLIGLLRRGRR
jgi:hypothetical protein